MARNAGVYERLVRAFLMFEARHLRFHFGDGKIEIRNTCRCSHDTLPLMSSSQPSVATTLGQ
jgi:hypothetical protein